MSSKAFCRSFLRRCGKSAANRVIRGGSHYLEADAARSANRNSQGPGGTSFVIGFRVVCTAGLK